MKGPPVHIIETGLQMMDLIKKNVKNKEEFVHLLLTLQVSFLRSNTDSTANALLASDAFNRAVKSRLLEND